MRQFKITFLVDGRKQTPYYVETPSELIDELETVFGTDCKEWLESVWDWATLAVPGESFNNDDEDVRIACVRAREASNVSKR